MITLGRNAQLSNVLAPPEFLAQSGVELFDIDRGGDVTFHGPGQLVAYPIFDLRSFEPKVGAVEFVRRLEEVLIRTCGDFGIGTQRIKGLTGVWTYALRNKPEAKIAAIGVHISRGVTTHGFALNVSTDLEFFSLIVPCGITGKPVTSMARELQKALTMEEVATAASRNFGRVFQAQMLWLESLDDLMWDSHGCAKAGRESGHSGAASERTTRAPRRWQRISLGSAFVGCGTLTSLGTNRRRAPGSSNHAAESCRRLPRYYLALLERFCAGAKATRQLRTRIQVRQLAIHRRDLCWP